jgi:hypothetical protein
MLAINKHSSLTTKISNYTKRMASGVNVIKLFSIIYAPSGVFLIALTEIKPIVVYLRRKSFKTLAPGDGTFVILSKKNL